MEEKVYTKEVVYIDPDFEDLIPSFLQCRRDEVGTIRQCLADSNIKEVIRLGHGMKGAGAGYGFEEITVIGRLIENAGNDDDSAEVEKGVRMLESYLSVVEIVFEEEE